MDPNRADTGAPNPSDRPNDPEHDSDDDVSITSSLNTINDSDDRWYVERIVSEIHFDNESRYLIQWTGYDMHEWTWEPARDLGAQMLEEWHRRKRDIERGDQEPFKASIWWNTRHEFLNERLELHDKRNEKRARLGLPQTSRGDIQWNLKYLLNEPQDSDGDEQSDSDYIDDGSGEDDEEEEWEEEDEAGSELDENKNNRNSGRSRRVNRPAVSKGAKTQGRRAGPGQGASDSLHINSSPEVPRKPTQAEKSIRIETGYQGNARRPSNPSGLPTPKTPLPSPVTSLPAPTNPQGPFPRGRTSALKRGPPAPPPQPANAKSLPGGSINVFGPAPDEKEARKRRLLLGFKSDKGNTHLHNINMWKSKKAVHAHEDVAPNFIGAIYKASPRVDADSPDPFTAAANFTKHEADSEWRQSAGASAAQSPTIAMTMFRNGGGDVLRKRALPDSVSDQPDAGAMEIDNAERPRSAKRRKSVRFDGFAAADTVESPVESIPMGLDHGSPVDGTSPAQSLGPPQRQSGEVVKKLICLSSNPSRRMECLFDRIAPPSQEWLLDFQARDVITFTHTCQAHNLVDRIRVIRFESISVGHVCPAEVTDSTENKDGAGHLANVAANLRHGAFGLASFRANYAILLYPTLCPEWDRVESSTCTPPPAAGPAELKFYIFEFQPGSGPADLATEEIERVCEVAGNHTGARALAFDLFFGLNYNDLIPSSAVSGPDRKHNFFLALPPAKEQLQRGILKWLESCSRGCRRSVITEPGHWSYFLGHESGTVIVHQSMVPDIRLFPHIGSLMWKPRSAFRFWVLRESPPPAGVGGGDGDSDADYPRHGHIALDEIFPYGDVFLLTPSFLLSQPKDSYALITWIKSNWDRCKAAWTIVVPDNIGDYLVELAVQSRDPDEVRLRSKIATKMHELIHASVWALHPMEALEMRAPLKYASGLIHPDDEQSLVNWLGLWSLANPSRYRRLHVVGSEHSPCRLHRSMSMPCYLPGTLGDLVLYSSSSSSSTSSSSFFSPENPDARSLDRARPAPDPTSVDLPALKAFMADIGKRTARVNSTLEFTHLYVYRNPVAYEDIAAADRHQDSKVELFDTYKQWFKHCNFEKWNRIHKNTYAGLFCTPGGQEPETGGRPILRLRDAWVALFRKVWPTTFSSGPNQKRFELLIWDPTAKHRLAGAGRSVPVQDLLPAQQALVRFVEETTPKHVIVGGESAILNRVWLGGFSSMPAKEPLSPLDMALEFLRAAVDQTKTFVPLGKTNLVYRGFLPVELTNSRDHPGTAASSVVFPKTPAPQIPVGPDMTGGVRDLSRLSAVIHPPPRTLGTNPSKYKNRLFTMARHARARDPEESFVYTFQPTTEWWAEQKAEGRHFEHVNVTTYDKLIRDLKKALPHVAGNLPAK